MRLAKLVVRGDVAVKLGHFDLADARKPSNRPRLLEDFFSLGPPEVRRDRERLLRGAAQQVSTIAV